MAANYDSDALPEDVAAPQPYLVAERVRVNGAPFKAALYYRDAPWSVTVYAVSRQDFETKSSAIRFTDPTRLLGRAD